MIDFYSRDMVDFYQVDVNSLKMFGIVDEHQFKKLASDMREGYRQAYGE